MEKEQIITVIIMILLTFGFFHLSRDYNDLVEDHNQLLGKYYDNTYEVKSLKGEIATLEKSRDYYKNYSFKCYNLSKSKDKKLEDQKESSEMLLKEKEKEYNSLYEEYWSYNNFTWTGCKDSRTVIKFCKGCNWNLKCTGSMRPTFSCENNLYFCSASKNEIKKGDIIAFLSPEYENEDYDTFYTIHRVIEITDKGYLTRGDNNIYTDNFVVPYQNIIGKLWKIEG